jgi:hypothetical protein
MVAAQLRPRRLAKMVVARQCRLSRPPAPESTGLPVCRCAEIRRLVHHIPSRLVMILLSATALLHELNQIISRA